MTLFEHAILMNEIHLGMVQSCLDPLTWPTAGNWWIGYTVRATRPGGHHA